MQRQKAKKELLSSELITLFLTGFIIGTIFHIFGKPIDAESALSFLNAIAEISATILSTFSAAALFLIERSPAAIRKVMSKGDFVAGFILFTLAILHSLASILTIEQDTPVDLRTFNARAHRFYYLRQSSDTQYRYGNEKNQC